MEVVFLGTSGCVPTEKRNLTGVLVNYLNQYYLFDCGEGTQRQMRHAGLNFMHVDHVFITHLHADHFLGLGGMIQSMDFMERTRPLNIYGPPGTKDVVDCLTTIGHFKLDYLSVKVSEVEEGLVYDEDNFTITCAKTVHTQNSVAYCFEEKPHRKFLKQKALNLGVPEGKLFSKLQDGFEVTVGGKTIKPDQVLSDPTPGRKIVITGDTRPCDNVIKLAKNADVLIHDATFSQEDAENTQDAAHSTTQEAAEVAKKTGAKKLYLTHISQRYTEPTKLEEEARKIFPQSYVAEDFMQIKIQKHW